MIHQSQIQASNSRSLLISGLFPSGEPFSDVVQADTSYEAQIRVIAQCRYSDAGGDLAVTRLADAHTGAAVQDSLLSADQDLLSEVEAVEYVLHTVQNSLIKGCTSAGGIRAEELYSYVEFFDLVLTQAPHAFDGLISGLKISSDEAITIDFEDSSGSVVELVPADALFALATVALEEGRVAAAYQVCAMASFTRVALSKACITALT